MAENKNKTRWSKAEIKMLKKWKAIIHEKTKEFGDEWTISYATQLPEPEEWEEPLVELLEISFKCKDCTHMWSNGQSLAHLFFHRKEPAGLLNAGADGQVLIWLQDEPCPRCSSTEIPVMIMTAEEADAVLSYLTLEIGWVIYKIPFTEDEKVQIEERRKMASTGSSTAKKNPQRSNKKTNKPAEGPPVTLKCVSEPAAVKKGPAKSRKTTTGTMAKSLPNQPKKTRWNKTPEQIRSEWSLVFLNRFSKFITRNEPFDRWTFELGMFDKEERPGKRCKIWDCPVRTSYRCSKCRNQWNSVKSKVSVRIVQNNRRPGDGKRQGGHITIARKTGQKCKKCPARFKDYYEKGDLDEGEIELVLDRLLLKVEIAFYGKKVEKTIPKEKIPGKPHERKLCENCANGDCDQVDDIDGLTSRFARL